jgi:oligoribonuclease NrnB/cAMP/cGMP phosphodiesterase (DHH superfamily)
MKIFYHDDADGKCAGHIVYEHVMLREDFMSRMTRCIDIDCIAVDYHNPFPVECIDSGEAVFIVDFSPDAEMFLKILRKTKNITWIDHHISAIQSLEDFSFLHGLRSVDYAGCVLTWAYLHCGFKGCHHNVSIHEDDIDTCPLYVSLIGDRDTWTFAYGYDSKAFHEAFRYLGEPTPDDGLTWSKLELQTDEWIKKGTSMLKYRDTLYQSMTDAWAYEAEFEGHTILACNSAILSSDIFGNRFPKYPFVAVYCHNGDKVKVSLYSANMDVVDIAKKYGGGGHPRACGFVVDNLPFRRLSK